MSPESEKNQWYSVIVTADVEAEEAVENVFGILDVLSSSNHAFGNKDTNLTEITAYFLKKPELSEISEKLESGLKLYGLAPTLIRSVSAEVVVEHDWLAEWKKHWKPTKAGPFLISPPWAEPSESGLIDIRIEPSMAFGTGTHESTRLCLELIGKHYRPWMSFLDIGTGTGILSIAAAKLAGSNPRPRFYACDTDDVAVGIAGKNAFDNETSFIEFETASISEHTPVFDFVCANMTIDIIEPLLATLVRVAASHLVVSGILAEQEERIRARLRTHHSGGAEVFRAGEWIALFVSF